MYFSWPKRLLPPAIGREQAVSWIDVQMIFFGSYDFLTIGECDLTLMVGVVGGDRVFVKLEGNPKMYLWPVKGSGIGPGLSDTHRTPTRHQNVPVAPVRAAGAPLSNGFALICKVPAKLLVNFVP
jgi:hypothetical protein